ncbi:MULTISPECIES: aspartate/glutamate racemase family protein [unclassified Actinotalea]|uniref:aspartate/glutamate racemase family protein n=1 Tax=unclassified Actinotalea TaxID=2638618 RepID=UPI0015F37B96|nr:MULTISPECIES: amino acid racemase [unclassified Actinotalea]
MRRIGLIGGTSWESTASYYAGLNRGVRERLGGTHSADLVLRSVDFAEVEVLQVAGDWPALGRRYQVEASALAAAGAEVVGILANTMHLVHDDVVRGAGPDVRVVHVVDAVAAAATALGATRVGLLGTRYTMSSRALYPDRMAVVGVDVVVPGPDDADLVNRVIYDELVQGQVREESRRAYLDVVARLADAGAQAVVLGCTELSLLLDATTPAPVPLLDSTSLHVTALLDAALAPRPVLEEEGAA